MIKLKDNAVPDKTLDQLVTEIKFYEGQAVVSYWEIGKRLSKAKEKVPHGEWQAWCKANLNYSYRTAKRLIEVYQELPNLPTSATLSLSKVDEILSLPTEDREEFLNTHEVEEMTVRQLRNEIKEWKNKAANAENKAREAEDRARDLEASPKVIEKEVIKEIIPKDYHSLKAKGLEAEQIKKEYEKEREENIRLSAKVKSLTEKEKEAVKRLDEYEGKEKTIRDLKSFMYQVDGFINQIGGLLYLTDYYKNLPKSEQVLFDKSAKRIKDWSDQLVYNIEKEKGETIHGNDLINDYFQPAT